MTLEEEIESLREKVKIYRFDYLTGLKQRRDFDHDLRKKFDEHDFYLVYYDVDNLHKMNREHGFAEGDRLIRQVAADIQHQAIPHTTYRTSGDELYAICCKEPTHNVQNATNVAVDTAHYDTVDEAIKALDQFMIEAKNQKKTRRIND